MDDDSPRAFTDDMDDQSGERTSPKRAVSMLRMGKRRVGMLRMGRAGSDVRRAVGMLRMGRSDAGLDGQAADGGMEGAKKAVSMLRMGRDSSSEEPKRAVSMF